MATTRHKNEKKTNDDNGGYVTKMLRFNDVIQNLIAKSIQAALETVKCEELQLELSATLKSKQPHQQRTGGGLSTSISTSMTAAMITASSVIGTGSSGAGGGGGGGGSTVTWAPTPTQPQQQDSEIDRIMAKIEQACYPHFFLHLFFPVSTYF